MQIKSESLIEELVEMTKDNLSRAEKFNALSTQALNQRITEGSWSILECLEHLNRYGDFYIPEIGKSIKNSKKPQEEVFKSGMLGNYFANSMMPKEKLNKMKTFKSMNPLGSELQKSVISTFIQQQQSMLDLLEQARSVSLIKNKTGISISKWISLRLGDSFRVVIYHNLRHIIQAENVLTATSQS